jgi:signal transduction histidine kinase
MAAILVVDDDPFSRQFLAALLRAHHHEVLEAGDGLEALDVLRQRRTARPIELIIADVLMPTLDGYELVRRIREDPDLASLPVIFHTGSYNQLDAHALARTCGVRYMLHKPALPDEILQAVNLSLAPEGADLPALVGETFSREHLRLVTNQLAREVTKLESVNGKLAVLLELSQQLALERDPRRLLQQFCDASRNLLAARQAAIGILDGESLRYFVSSSPDRDAGDNESALLPQETLRQMRQARRPRRSREENESGIFHSHLSAPISSPSCVYGWLCLTDKLDGSDFTDDEEHLAGILAGNLGRVYENDVLFVELLRQSANLEQEISERKRAEQQLQRLSAQILQAQEMERRRIARELHDEVGQMLTALRFNLQALHRSKSPSTSPHLEESLTMVDRTLQQVRNLSVDLRPSMLDDLGLQAALRWYLDRLAQRAGLTAHFAAEPFSTPLSPDMETACFRVAQEALTNTLRHARAQVVSVELSQNGSELLMRITDDGVGFDVRGALEKASQGRSLGLLGLRERVALLGGRIGIHSALGQGTEIRVAFPLGPQRAATSIIAPIPSPSAETQFEVARAGL